MEKKYEPLSNQYGRCAVRAYELLQTGMEAEAAWYQAAEEIIRTPSGIKKGCPKNAFLGVLGLNKRKSVNAEYALKALEIIKANSERALQDINVARFWEEEMGMANKKYNSQVHVVLDLVSAGYL